jgi:hypothetical protein
MENIFIKNAAVVEKTFLYDVKQHGGVAKMFI